MTAEGVKHFAVTRATEPVYWELRQGFLNASEIGAAAGVDPWKSPKRLWAEKSHLLGPEPETPLMRRGRWLEGAAIVAVREQRPDWQIGACSHYFYHEGWRTGCTPDYVAETDEPGLTNMQVKVVAKPVFERDWRDGPPLKYQLQALHEAMHLDAARSWLVALVIDTYSADIHLYPVPRHAGAEARIRDIATDFWAGVASGKPPPAQPALDAETVDQLYPVSRPEPVLDLSRDNMLPEVLAERARLKADVKATEARLSEIDVIIKDKMTDHERATLPGWAISWKSYHRGRVVIPPCDFRVLRVSRAKEEAA